MTSTIDILLSASTPLPVVEAAHGIGRALAESGCSVEIVEDRLPPFDPERATLVIGPHEVYPYLAMGPGELDEALARTVLICTARPSAPAWQRTLRYAEKAGAVLDISDAGVTAFAAAGITAQRFRLGYEAANDHSSGGIETRPLDVAFLGSTTPRRERIVAAAAASLSRRDIDLRFTEGVASRTNPVDGFLSGDEKYRLLAATKIVLNLHPSDDPLFEWFRAQDALTNGCLFVSELSSGATPLDPGLHFVSVNHSHLGPTLDRLLDEPDRLEQIRATGSEFFRQHVRLIDEIQTVRAAVSDLPESVPQRIAAPDRSEDEVLLAGDGDDDGEGGGPISAAAVSLRQNAVLKRLFVEIRSLRREVAHVRHAVEAPGEPLVRISSTPGWEAAGDVDVSVIVTLHNYARFVREAIETSLASEGVKVEVVVIDDRSADEGPTVIRDLMRERKDEAILFLEQRVNTGVQRARNLAFSHARGPFAFVLDADNVVYPRGIAKLRESLSTDAGSAFAYGIIERFNEAGGLGLMGVEGWDERRLARSHYIDAMALVRVDAWREVGGYVTDPALELGWEDYDLWLNFASHGYRGIHVREIVGRYRVHGISSLAITSLDTEELMQRLQARHAQFFHSVSDDADD